MRHLTLCAVLFLTSFAQSYKILGVWPFPGTSHYNLARALMLELAERGHEVTFINPFGEKVPPAHGRYKDLYIGDLFDEEEMAKKTGGKKKDWNMFNREKLNPFMGAFFLATMTGDFLGHILNHTKIQDLLHSDEKFDVVITDNFISDAIKGFAPHFDAPLVLLSPVWQNFFINQVTGNPSSPSYIPNMLSRYVHPMSFQERLTNTLLDGFNYMLYHLFFFPKQNAIAKQFIPRVGDLYDVLYNTSLVLLNGHASLNQPVPSVPNMIEVGGLHVKPPGKLPKDLQEFFDNAKEGVIYFSMGSNLQGTEFPEEQKQAFIKAFSKLKQKVLWKYESEELPNKPDNVKLIKWAPQNNILAHPNLKLFITHGGFVSSCETANNGVPVLVVPIYGDQYQNAHFADSFGFGRFLRLKEVTENSLIEIINEIVYNPKYKQKAMLRQKLFHDRPQHPLDTAVYWVEYVARHRGAPHLRVGALDLTWYQYYLLDVYLVLAIIVFSSTVITSFIIFKIWKWRSSKKTTKTKKTD